MTNFIILILNIVTKFHTCDFKDQNKLGWDLFIKLFIKLDETKQKQVQSYNGDRTISFSVSFNAKVNIQNNWYIFVLICCNYL